MKSDNEKLDPKFKKKWVKALRSGNYKQAIGSLQRVKAHPEEREAKLGFCCLGVACDLVNPKGWIIQNGLASYQAVDSLGRRNPSIDDCGPQSAGLPEYTRKLINLPRLEQSLLIKMNDDGSSFKKIANYIEKNL